MLYSEKVMDHFRNPRNVGKIEDADGIGEVGNPVCGDIMKMYIKVNDDDVITDVKFNTFGCGSAIATSSMATEMIKGKSVTEALQLTNKAVVEALDGLPTHKIHCSVLAEEAVKAAVIDFYKKKGREIPEELKNFEINCESCAREPDRAGNGSSEAELPRGRKGKRDFRRSGEFRPALSRRQEAG